MQSAVGLSQVEGPYLKCNVACVQIHIHPKCSKELLHNLLKHYGRSSWSCVHWS